MKRSDFGLPLADAGDEGLSDSGWLRAFADVRSKVTKSLGAVGPGNCADK